MELYQIKKLLHREGNNKMKRQLSEQDKIFANDIFNKGLIFKIYREVINLIKTIILKNRQKTIIDIFPKITDTRLIGPGRDA